MQIKVPYFTRLPAYPLTRLAVSYTHGFSTDRLRFRNTNIR